MARHIKDESYENAIMRMVVQPLVDDRIAMFDAYNQIPHEFSKEFYKRARRVFRMDKAKRNFRTSMVWCRRAAVCFMVLVMLMLGACAAIKPLREQLANAVLTWYEEFVDIKFEADKETISTAKILTKAPEGYELTEIYDENGYLDMLYQNEEGDLFTFSRRPYSENELTQYDSEYHSLKKIKINNAEGMLFYAHNENDSNIVTWIEGKYVYELYGYITPEEIVEIAESVK